MSDGQEANTSATLWWACGLFLVSIGAMAGLELFGRASRKVLADASSLRPGISRAVLVERPEDAYRLWKKEGVRGRVIASVCGRWERVYVESFDPYLTSAAFPPRFFDISAWWERQLDGKNFLFLAAQNGIAREIICVLPEPAYRGMFDPPEHAGQVQAGPVSSKTYEGYRRLYTTTPSAIPLKEPLLIYIGASYMEEKTPDEVHLELEKCGWSSDLVVFCEEKGDERTSNEARERLIALAAGYAAQPALDEGVPR